jgi:hypothetical protein
MFENGSFLRRRKRFKVHRCGLGGGSSGHHASRQVSAGGHQMQTAGNGLLPVQTGLGGAAPPSEMQQLYKASADVVPPPAGMTSAAAALHYQACRLRQLYGAAAGLFPPPPPTSVGSTAGSDARHCPSGLPPPGNSQNISPHSNATTAKSSVKQPFTIENIIGVDRCSSPTSKSSTAERSFDGRQSPDHMTDKSSSDDSSPPSPYHHPSAATNAAPCYLSSQPPPHTSTSSSIPSIADILSRGLMQRADVISGSQVAVAAAAAAAAQQHQQQQLSHMLAELSAARAAAVHAAASHHGAVPSSPLGGALAAPPPATVPVKPTPLHQQPLFPVSVAHQQHIVGGVPPLQRHAMQRSDALPVSPPRTPTSPTTSRRNRHVSSLPHGGSDRHYTSASTIGDRFTELGGPAFHGVVSPLGGIPHHHSNPSAPHHPAINAAAAAAAAGMMMMMPLIQSRV